MDDINILVFSSMIFMTNVVIAYWYEYYIYSAFFLLLMITSMWNHYCYTNNSYIFDKISVFMVVFYGGYLFYNKCANSEEIQFIYTAIVISTFLASIYLYYGGYIFEKYCFHKDKAVADWFHITMHTLSSIGHHFIIIL